MKSFLDHLKEEVLPTVQVADGGLDISKPAVRAAINAAIAGVVSQPAVTPYVVFNRLSKLLAQYHIVLPKRFLEGDKGVEVFELRQFGHKMGMTDSGEFVNEVPSTHYLFLQYGILSPFGITYAKPVVGGMFKVAARIVDKEELDKLIDMAEITMNEEAECMQAIYKANAHGEDMEDVTDDKKKVGNKKAVAASEKKSLDEEDFNAGQVLKNVRDADAVKNPNGPAAMRNKAEDESLERAGKGLARDMKEEKNDLKDTCWKGYTAKGLKKKGNRMVPNCVPVEEAADKDRELSKLANKAISKGHPVKKLPAGRAEYSTLPKGMAKGINLERGRWSGHGRFNEEQIDEVSLEEEDNVTHFVPKPPKRKVKVVGGNKEEMDQQHKKLMTYHKAHRKNMKEEQINELEKKTIGNYLKKAHVSGLAATDDAADAYHRKDYKELQKSNRTSEKRERGVNLAIDKLTGRAHVSVKEEVHVKSWSDGTHTAKINREGKSPHVISRKSEKDLHKEILSRYPSLKGKIPKASPVTPVKEEKGDRVVPGSLSPETMKQVQDLSRDLASGERGATFALKGNPTKTINVSSDAPERGNKIGTRAPLNEKHLTPPEKAAKEKIVLKLKPHLAKFKKRYGKSGKSVMYGAATNRAKQVAEEKKDTVLVSPKGYKGGGQVTRIPKKEYDPKKHNLASE